MSTTADLVIALKKELKSAQMTYADLAQATHALGLFAKFACARETGEEDANEERDDGDDDEEFDECEARARRA